MPRSLRRSDRHREALRLARLRSAGPFTQLELAEAFGVGQSAVAQWESGGRTLPGSALVLLELYEARLGLGSPGAALEPGASLRGRSLATAQAAALWTVLRGSGAVLPSPLAGRVQSLAMRQFI